MTIYKLDGSDDIVEGVRALSPARVFEHEIIMEFSAGMAEGLRISLNHDEATAMISNLATGLALLRGLMTIRN